MVYYNPYIAGEYSPLNTLNNPKQPGFFFFMASQTLRINSKNPRSTPPRIEGRIDGR